jgi:chloride channel protein, CIC family
VGGVFTPTLFTGAAWGYLLGVAAAALLPWAGLNPESFALVGMGAFLAASTGAPVMAILMLFELTLNYQVLIPAVIASGAGYYLCRSLGVRPLYGEALARKGAAAVAQHLATLKVGELVAKDSTCLLPQASFGEVARAFLQSRHDSLHVVDESGRFLGIVSLHDIKPYLDQEELESLLIARDVMHEETPRLAPEQTMSEALDLFGMADTGRLPVTSPDGVFFSRGGDARGCVAVPGREAAGEGCVRSSDLVVAGTVRAKQPLGTAPGTVRSPLLIQGPRGTISSRTTS